MNATQITQIAQHLNTSPNAIKRCEEWANCYFVVVHGRSPRFVSKKVVAMQEDKLANLLVEIGWMLDKESVQRGEKWTTFDLNGAYYPRDVYAAIAEGKKAGFTSLFYNKQQQRVGVLTEQL